MDYKYQLWIKRILLVLVNIASFPSVYFSQLSNGLDASWVFALNYINTSDAKFGEDYFFTYGPLGFLGHCQPLGKNLLLGILFWLLITFIQIYLYKRVIDTTEHIVSVVIAFGLMILALPVSEADIYLCFLALMALFFVYKQDDFYSKWIAVFLSGVIFLFKFSGTILLIASLILFFLCALAEKKPLKTTGIFLCCIGIGPVFYLFYHPSIRALIRYGKAAAEISMGYNQSMSIDIYEAYYIWVIFVVACYVFLLVYGILTHKKQWNCFLILSPACFFWYKEGFVRNDGHHILAITGILLVCSLLILHMDLIGWQKYAGGGILEKASLCCMCVLVAVPVMGNGKTLSGSLQSQASSIFQLPKLISDYRKQDRSLLQEHNREFMDIIGEHTYTTFPWEITENISYANPNFKIAPLLQNYTVYTPYLDKLNARFYAGEDAPEYVILYLHTIDGRLPLLEAPVTWENIYKHYEVAAADEEKYLLKKRTQALEKESSAFPSKEYGIREFVEIPENCTFLKVDTELSIQGQLENLFYKVLPVQMEVTYTDGSVRAGRVILEQLREGIDLGSLIWDASDFQSYMNLRSRVKTVAGISLTGPGVRQYNGRMEVTFFNGGWK